MMIGHVPQQAFGAVQLFEEHHAGQLVREGLRAEGDEVLCLVAHGVVQAEGPAYDEAGAARPVGGQSVQKAGKFAGGHGSPFLIEADWYILRTEGGEYALAFFFHAARRGQGRIRVLDDGFRHLAETGYAFQIMLPGFLPEVVGLAYSYDAQWFQTHAPTINPALHGGKCDSPA